MNRFDRKNEYCMIIVGERLVKMSGDETGSRYKKALLNLSGDRCDRFAPSLIAVREVRDVVEYKENAFVCISGAHNGDRGVGTGVEKVFGEREGLSRIGVDDTTVAEDEHTFADVPGGDFIDSTNNSLSKGM